MIISHRHRFIFIKPRKVAGSSLEVVLAKYLGPNDVIPPITDFSSHHDKDRYILKPQNAKGFYDHLSPKEIESKVGKKHGEGTSNLQSSEILGIWSFRATGGR